jgi:hypothetical protein
MPIAGQALIEHQIRVARACGCVHIVVLVDQLPAALVAAFDRLRGDGIDVDVARDCRDAADRIHPDEQLLLMITGLVTSQYVVETLTRLAKPTLLTVPTDLAISHFERIDGVASWTGLALLNGQILRQTVATLGDWSLGSTLLRSAVQSGAQRLTLENKAELAVIATIAHAHAISGVLIARASERTNDRVERWITRPLARVIAPYVIARNLPFDRQIALPLVALGVAPVLALMGWFIAAFVMILIATLAEAVAQIAADVSARTPRALRIFQLSKRPTLSAALLALGFAVALPNVGWAPLILALWAVSSLLLHPRVGEALKPWSPTAESSAVVMIVALLAGQPIFGMAAIVLHCLADQLWSRYFNDSI